MNSGNGKTSLINAGIVPFFISRGYAVFNTRPRPPWSTTNPVDAFKECVLRDITLPLFSASDIELLSSVRAHLESVPGNQDHDSEEKLARLEDKISRFQEKAPDINDFKTRLKDH